MTVLEPGLFVYRSNRLEVLVELLAWVMRQPGQQPEDPMVPARIAVANLGMRRWLEHRLAERWGVLAQVDTIFPALAFDQVVKELLGESCPEPEADPWSRETITWALVDEFAGIIANKDPRYGPLREYLEQDSLEQDSPQPSGDIGARAFGLARQVGEVFDRYITYRPEMALAWTEGRATPGLPDTLAWQPVLWQALVQRLGTEHAARRAHQAHRALEGLGQPNFVQPLRVFGMSSLPPGMLELAGQLAHHMPVELYLLCPSNVYWADLHQRQDRIQALSEAPVHTLEPDAVDAVLTEPGNPLLAAFGRVMRDFQIAVEGLASDVLVDRHDLFVDMAQAKARPEGADPGFEDPKDHSPCALAHLQSDVLHARRSPPVPLIAGEVSLQFHACHGQIRQVEVLKEVLWGLFDADPELEPRDVVVMCPDIEAFAPLISAVFEGGPAQPWRVQGGRPDWGRAGAPRIPFTVADLSLRRTNPIAEALLQLLGLGETRLTASGLLELLSMPVVRQRFEMSPEDMETVQRWVVDSGLRWGADATDRGHEGQPAELGNTIQFALDRLLLGVCLKDDPEQPVVDTLPYDAMAPSQADLLGRFVEFLTAVVQLHGELRAPRPVQDWLDLIRGGPEAPGLLERFTHTEDSERWLTWSVDEILQEIIEVAERAQQQAHLTASALAVALSGQFDLPNPHGPHERGGVTFSSLVPMRGLPHRVVCLLGMDEGAFPRQGSARAFDLITRAPRHGDRSPSADDRGALLEAIMAARSHLIVVYSGRDVRTNETRAPAVPIVELMDVVDASFMADGGPASEALTHTHPLQAFSPRNFGCGGPAFSFSPGMAESAAALKEHRLPPRPFFSAQDVLPDEPEAETEPLELSTLAAYFKAPHRVLLRRRFGLVDVGDGVQVIPDREPFDIEPGLERWRVNDALLRGLSESSSVQAEARLKAEGRLPLGLGAEIALKAPRTLVTVLADAMKALPEPAQQVRVHSYLAGQTLVGHVHGLRGTAEVVCVFRKDGTGSAWRWVLEPWVRLLARQVAAPHTQAQVVIVHPDDSKRPKVARWRTFAVTPDVAAGHLEDLVQLYLKGQTRPLPILPNGSFLLAWNLRKAGFDKVNLHDLAEVQGAIDAMPPKTRDGAIKAVQGAWRPYTGRGDAEDFAVARLYGEVCPAVGSQGVLRADFVATAMLLWGPIIAARTLLKKAPALSPEGAQ